MDLSSILSILGALLTAGGFAATIYTIVKSNAKTEANRAADAAITHNELKHQGENLKELSKRVDKHNGFAERLPVVERDIEVVNHRIADLEKGQEKLNDRLTRRNSI